MVSSNVVSPFNSADFSDEAKSLYKEADIKAAVEKALAEAKELLKDKEAVLGLVKYIDLTTLAGDDTKERVVKLVDRALKPVPGKDITCGAVCVYPQRVADAKGRLVELGNNLSIASVAAGFPSGQYHLKSKVLEVELTVADGATEIDIVISRALALEDRWEELYKEVAELKKACGNAHLKTILATGELGSVDKVFKASMASILGGSDFIKTSTGKETVNATLENTFVMCQAIKLWHQRTGKKIGYKPAGGIKTPEEALGYVSMVKAILGDDWLNPELFRIGASSLLDNIVKAVEA